MADTEKLIKTPENYAALASSEPEGACDTSSDSDLHLRRYILFEQLDFLQRFFFLNYSII